MTQTYPSPSRQNHDLLFNDTNLLKCSKKIALYMGF